MKSISKNTIIEHFEKPVNILLWFCWVNVFIVLWVVLSFPLVLVLAPTVYAIIVCFVWIVIILFLFLLLIMMIRSFKKFRTTQRFTALVVVIASMLFIIGMIYSYVIVSFFGQETFTVVSMEDQRGMYAVSQIATIPEGQGFTLYKINALIFRDKIAESYRWHSYMEPWVELYIKQNGKIDQDPSFKYNTETRQLEKLSE